MKDLFPLFDKSIILPNGTFTASFLIPCHHFVSSAYRMGSYIIPLTQLVYIYLFIWITCRFRPDNPSNFKLIFHGGTKNYITYLGGGIKKAAKNYTLEIENNWCTTEECRPKTTTFRIRDRTFKDFRNCIIKKMLSDPIAVNYNANNFGFCPHGQNTRCNVRKIKNSEWDNPRGHKILCDTTLTLYNFIQMAILYPETLVQQQLKCLLEVYILKYTT